MPQLVNHTQRMQVLGLEQQESPTLSLPTATVTPLSINARQLAI